MKRIIAVWPILAFCALLNTGCASLKPTAEQVQVAEARPWAGGPCPWMGGTRPSPDYPEARCVANLLQCLLGSR